MTIDAEKAFGKVQHNFIIKTLLRVGTEGYFLKQNTFTKKLTANIILNVELLDAFLLRSGAS